MSIEMTPEQKEIGKGNFNRVVGKLAETDQPSSAQQMQAGAAGGEGITRRRFMKGLIAAAATVPVSAAAYFGYDLRRFGQSFDPVRTGIIGTGDEGGVLVGEHNSNVIDFIGYCDIRPMNQNRIFQGEPTGPRKGFNHPSFRERYGLNPREHIRRFDTYQEMLRDPRIELVVIALPLHLHAEASIAALRAGKHVLCEKLMGWNITQCKNMIRAADESQKLLSIGHQRHYSMLYAHANEVIQSGVLGDIKYIRWHRNNVRPLLDSQGRTQQDPELSPGNILYRDSWRKAVDRADREALESRIRELGYENMNELVRWRLYTRTGGGLMAELGSHQLDACSIFLGKKRPLSVTAVGGTHFYRDDREVEDHVYCTFEFPGECFDEQAWGRGSRKNDIVTVTYSSISTNDSEGYGEFVMGSKGSLVVEKEENAYLHGIQGRTTEVTANSAGGRPVLDTSSSAAPAERQAASTGQAALGHAPPSKGYREEMEHLAYCIRELERLGSNPSQEERDLYKPRCDGRAAMADAIIALTANKAMKNRERITFRREWYDAASTEVPDAEMVERRISSQV